MSGREPVSANPTRITLLIREGPLLLIKEWRYARVGEPPSLAEHYYIWDITQPLDEHYKDREGPWMCFDCKTVFPTRIEAITHLVTSPGCEEEKV